MTDSLLFVDVAVPLPLHQLFTYRVPPHHDELITPGLRLAVPFGSRLLTGLAIRIHREPPTSAARSVEKVLDRQPLLDSRLLELGMWMADYYCAPPGEALRALCPPGVFSRGSLRKAREWPVRKRLAVTSLADSKSGAPAPPLSTLQQRVYEALKGMSVPVPLREFCSRQGCGDSVVRALETKGLIRIEATEIDRIPQVLEANPDSRIGRHRLSQDQSRVLTEIEESLATPSFKPLLLHGVTGSGKTEIYLNAIDRVLKMKGSALLLVPEIGLTPQMIRHMLAWFGSKAAILHSRLSDGERFDQWRRIRRGDARVVVGTRSAIFAPLQDLRLLIVDEEHDSSYKQEEAPRYHARDTALKRGQLQGLVVILGSATPQLETFYLANEKKSLRYMRLSGRILERRLPEVQIVDMRAEFERHGKAAVLSEPLVELIQDRLTRREQSLILMNRRGYSWALLCRSCGYVESCRNCSIGLTYHQENRRLVCHYCGYTRPVPRQCVRCSREYIQFIGEGTERIQELLTERFPEARVDRLDRDSAKRKGALERILERFDKGRTQILVGTQMIAKGHDFPNVTLVGVLAADQALRMADFRAAERTFQLLTQVAGRAGRGERPGQVIVQTYFPNHYCLKFGCAQDYHGFYRHESQFRKRFRYPPYSALANLLVRGPDPEQSRQLAENLARKLCELRNRYSSESKMRILGPAPAALERLRGDFRWQVLIKTTSRRELHEVIRGTLDRLREEKAPTRQITIDVDPVSLL